MGCDTAMLAFLAASNQVEKTMEIGYEIAML
jgi:hypothetical protein